jgi:hypothetical protein
VANEIPVGGAPDRLTRRSSRTRDLDSHETRPTGFRPGGVTDLDPDPTSGLAGVHPVHRRSGAFGRDQVLEIGGHWRGAYRVGAPEKLTLDDVGPAAGRTTSAQEGLRRPRGPNRKTGLMSY